MWTGGAPLPRHCHPLQISLAPLCSTSEICKEAIFALGNGISRRKNQHPSPTYTPSGLDGTPFFQIRFLQEGFGSLTLLDKQKLPLIQLDQDSFAFRALPAARAGGALHPARPLFWSADLAAGSNFAVDGQQAEAAVRILGAERRRFAPIFSFAQPISLPGATSPSTVSRRRLPSGSSAQRSIPSETCPAILRGAKLATSTTVLPTRSSGL